MVGEEMVGEEMVGVKRSHGNTVLKSVAPRISHNSCWLTDCIQITVHAHGRKGQWTVLRP